VIHQGPGQEATGDTNDIWSHNWSLEYYFDNTYIDGKKIESYTCQPETSSGGSMASIGVMCHEFGHNLGALAPSLRNRPAKYSRKLHVFS